MKHGVWLGLVWVCACALDDVPAADEVAIEGTVRDDFTDRGVSGAKVEFVSDALDHAEAVSEQEGRFVLHVALTDGVRFGTLEASRAGYATSASASVYFDGTTPRATLRIRPKDF